MKPSIDVISLSKRYQGERLFLKSVRHLFDSAPKDVRPWILKDLNLSVERGQAVGLVGRNGAGKTTLLRILSRLTCPSEGKAIVRGRVASLLEMGSGFHPDLTGRENIFLNGAFLGMRTFEVQRELDAIVDFSGVSKSIDMPIKRYSKGMYVRLAFAVAVHLSADILLMDEFLDSGDVAFQEKCLERMKRLTEKGKSILFVSHNLNHVERLCSHSVWLEGAHIQEAGETRAILPRYRELC